MFLIVLIILVTKIVSYLAIYNQRVAVYNMCFGAFNAKVSNIQKLNKFLPQEVQDMNAVELNRTISNSNIEDLINGRDTKTIINIAVVNDRIVEFKKVLDKLDEQQDEIYKSLNITEK